MNPYRYHGCPNCARTVEFRDNEIRRKCPFCGKKLKVVSEVDSGIVIRVRVEEDDGEKADKKG